MKLHQAFALEESLEVLDLEHSCDEKDDDLENRPPLRVSIHTFRHVVKFNLKTIIKLSDRTNIHIDKI